LFDAQASFDGERQGLQTQLAKNRNAIVKTFFDIGDCLIDLNASLPKHRGLFGSTSWDYFTARTKDTFGLDGGTASKYMSIARNGTLRQFLADNAYNGEGLTTLYELSRIDSQDKFAKIKRQKYLTAGGERLPHSKAEAWRKECDKSKDLAKERAAPLQGCSESADQGTIIPDDVTPPVGADPTEGERPGEVQTGDIELTGRFTTDESAPVTRAITPEELVYLYAPRCCAAKQLTVMQKRLELNFKQFQDAFPEIAGYYVIVKLTLEKPEDID
jgi:hypothetical protein